MSKMSSYVVMFSDNLLWESESLKAEWNTMPNKPIKEFAYSLGDKLITMAGYEEYNHLVEYVALTHEATIVSRIMLLGKMGDKVDIISIDFNARNVSRHIAHYGEEYYGSKSTGWKPGILGSDPKFYVTEVI
jgi:hypothetical protein